MTSVLQEDDKILSMYKQYKTLLNNNVKRNKNELQLHPRTTMLVASQLTVAHMLDHVVCLIKEKKLRTVKKTKKTPKTLLETFSTDQLDEIETHY
jgi:hypothetical protein